MSLLHRARKNILLKFMTEAVIRLLAMIFIVLVARLLGDRDYGLYSTIIYWGGLLTIVSDLGLNLLLIREVSRRQERLATYAGNILSIRLLLSGVSLALTIGLLSLLGYSRELVLLIFLGVFGLLCNHLVEFFGAVTNSLERFEIELLVKSLNKGLTVLAGLGALALGTGLWGLILALAGAHLVSTLLNGRIIRKHITPLSPQRDPVLWRQLMRSTLPIGFSAILITAYVRLDIILMSLLGIDLAEIGWYTVPVKINEMLSIFPYLVMASLFPIFSSLSGPEPDRMRAAYQKSLRYLLLIALPLTLLLYRAADPGLEVLFGPQYRNSVPSLRIIIWAVPLIFVHYALLHTLLALNRERLIITGSGLALVFNLGSNLILLPRYGYLGASATTVATELLLVVFYLGHLQRSDYRFPLMSFMGRLALSAGLTALVFHILGPLPLGIQIPASLIVYLASLIPLRLVVRDDLRLVKQIFREPAPLSDSG